VPGKLSTWALFPVQIPIPGIFYWFYPGPILVNLFFPINIFYSKKTFISSFFRREDVTRFIFTCLLSIPSLKIRSAVHPSLMLTAHYFEYIMYIIETKGA
jgi:hypothetical protein